jgi:hypothetical protein
MSHGSKRVISALVLRRAFTVPALFRPIYVLVTNDLKTYRLQASQSLGTGLRGERLQILYAPWSNPMAHLIGGAMRINIRPSPVSAPWLGPSSAHFVTPPQVYGVGSK